MMGSWSKQPEFVKTIKKKRQLYKGAEREKIDICVLAKIKQKPFEKIEEKLKWEHLSIEML